MITLLIIVIFIILVIVVISGKLKESDNTISGSDDNSEYSMSGNCTNKLVYEGVDVTENVGSTLIMIIDHVLNISGKEILAGGKIENGELAVDDEVYIQCIEKDKIIKSRVIEIIEHNESIQVANAGQTVGVIFKGIARSDVHDGDYITK